MTSPLDALQIIFGVLLIVFGLNDVFRTLLHPSGEGPLARRVVAIVWGLSRRTSHRLGSLAGPLAGVAIVGTWTLLQVIGWALIYLPYVPEGFLYAPGVDPARYNNVQEALYVSLVNLSTLGFGDVVVTDPSIRLLAPLQAVAGFILLTATITWFTQVQSPVARSRTVALHLTLLEKAEYARTLPTADPVAVSSALQQLSTEIVQVRIDLTQIPDSYFFRDADPRTSLAHSISYSYAISAAAQESPSATIRTAGNVLADALDDLAGCLRRRFLPGGGTTEEVFRRYALDHGHHPPAGEPSGHQAR